jgi:hypothetical protein
MVNSFWERRFCHQTGQRDCVVARVRGELFDRRVVDNESTIPVSLDRLRIISFLLKVATNVGKWPKIAESRLLISKVAHEGLIAMLYLCTVTVSSIGAWPCP